MSAVNLVPAGAPLLDRLVASKLPREPALAGAVLRRSVRGGRVTTADPELAAAMVERATAMGYLGWPQRLRPWVGGKDVLDVGCGTGLHGIGFMLVGARSYTGIDPRVRLDRDRTKNIRTGGLEAFGWLPGEIMRAFPGLRLVRGTFEMMAPDEQFDLAVLRNATEHLLALDEVLAGIARRLRPSGRLIYNHHNFYAWNGHHMRPKSVHEIDPEDAEQRRYIDWAHLELKPAPDHYFHRGLNRIRLDELRELTERHFAVETWEELPTEESRGGRRLTPEIRARFAQYDRRELLTQHVFCIARPRG